MADDGSVGIAPTAPAADGGEGSPVDELEDREPASVRGGAEVDAATLRERISELRGEIRALGPVNVDALEDLSEERERHSFLDQQVADRNRRSGSCGRRSRS